MTQYVLAALKAAPRWPAKGLEFDEIDEWATKYREWFNGMRADALRLKQNASEAEGK